MKKILLACIVVALGCDRKTSQTSSAPATPSSTPIVASAAPSVTPSAAPSTASVALDASASTSKLVDFNADTLAAASPSFEAVIGDWYVAEDGGQRGVRVDGTKWQQGTPSASLADQAKKLYGDKHAEFLDGVKAFAFFPLAIYTGDPPKGDFRISMRFYPEAGRIDQGAGIAFDIGEDGSYQGVRANALENNVLCFKVVKGRRTVLENIRNTPTATKTWHTLQIEVRGSRLTSELDGQKRLDRDLGAAPRGRVGLWSKADSQVLFDDYRIEVL